MSLVGRTWRGSVPAGALLAAAGAAHAMINAALLRRPDPDPPPATDRVSVLLPVRDEAGRVEECLRSILDQTCRGQVLVLDDGSTDGTGDLVRRLARSDPSVTVLDGKPLPDGWLGKPHACQQLADAADEASTVLVFVDADVVLKPAAVASTVDLLGRCGLDLVSPYPRQLALTAAERLVQPLLQWSWLTFLPLRVAERSARPSLSAANGQLLAVRRRAYERAGGHAAIRGEVLDDVALLRAVKRTGGRGGVADGTALASCRMYGSWPELRDGYSKSLWSAFGSRRGAAAVVGLLALAYVVPALAAASGSITGLAGYAFGVTSRVVAARRTGGRVWPDALAHPAAVVTLSALTIRSWREHSAGRLTWKGRRLATGTPPVSPERGLA